MGAASLARVALAPPPPRAAGYLFGDAARQSPGAYRRPTHPLSEAIATVVIHHDKIPMQTDHNS